MITLEFIYVLMGVMLTKVAFVNARDVTHPRRVQNTLFWGIYAVTFLVGSRLPDSTNGELVLIMVLIASIGKLGKGSDTGPTGAEREISAGRWGNKLFIPVLIIPAGTLLGTLFLKAAKVGDTLLADPKQVTLGLAILIALCAGMIMLRPSPAERVHASRRLLDSVGGAAVLPQSLAAPGAVFAAAGVGGIIKRVAGTYLPLGTALAAVIIWWRHRSRCCDRDAFRVLRNADDAHGGKLQYCTGGPSRIARCCKLKFFDTTARAAKVGRAFCSLSQTCL